MVLYRAFRDESKLNINGTKRRCCRCGRCWLIYPPFSVHKKEWIFSEEEMADREVQRQIVFATAKCPLNIMTLERIE